MSSINPAVELEVSSPPAVDVAAPGPSWLLGRDLARFGAAVGLAVALGAVQVLLIPRLLDVRTYGEYRLFLVYASYLGVLHFGLADGAFVRWVGHSPAVIRREAPRVAAWVLGVQACLLGAAAAVSAWSPSALARTYLVAFAFCALCLNTATLASYALQAAGEFTSAGRVAVLAPGLFVAAVVLIPIHSLAPILTAYVAAYGVAAAIGSVSVARLPSQNLTAQPTDPPPPTPRLLLRIGLPVLGANVAAGLSSSIDRILVSLSVPVGSFALYGFATTIAVVASAATQVLSRVSLSHAARRSAGDRAGFLAGFYHAILAGFGVGLIALPAFEHVVARSLPAYAAALPIVRAAAVGSLFWVAVHVVLVGTLQSYGLVRRQFALELGGAALVAIACVGALQLQLPLWRFAASAALAAVVTWASGVVLVVRSVPAARGHASMRFLLIAGAQCGALAIALAATDHWIAQSMIYGTLASAPTGMAARSAWAHWRHGEGRRREP